MTEKPSERPLWLWALLGLLASIGGCFLIGGAFIAFNSFSYDQIRKKNTAKTEHLPRYPQESTGTKPKAIIKPTPAAEPEQAKPQPVVKKWDTLEEEALAAEIDKAAKRFAREREALAERHRKEEEAWKRGEGPTNEEIRERLIRARARLTVARQELADSKRRLEIQRYLTNLYNPPK
jgi:hypothetical protein